MTPRGGRFSRAPPFTKRQRIGARHQMFLGLGSREHSAIGVLFARATKNSPGLKEWFGASGVGAMASSNPFLCEVVPLTPSGLIPWTCRHGPSSRWAFGTVNSRLLVDLLSSAPRDYRRRIPLISGQECYFGEALVAIISQRPAKILSLLLLLLEPPP